MVQHPPLHASPKGYNSSVERNTQVLCRKVIEMDLRLKEITWVRLLSLLLWTVLMILKRGITQLIEIVERRTFDVNVQAKEERGREKLIDEATLLPPLSDELVLSQIWPLLHKRVNVSLLWRLRKVNRAWKNKVGTTLEWVALEFVRIDSPGFLRLLEKRGERRPSLRERVEKELDSLDVILAEDLSEFSLQVVNSRSVVVSSEPIEGVGESGSVRVSFEAEASSTARCRSCVCRETCYTGRQSIDGGEIEWSEEEEIETCSSFSGSSLRVYYPRHSLKG